MLMPYAGDGHWAGTPMPKPISLVVDEQNKAPIAKAEAATEEGKALILMGPVGAGKTTILEHIARATVKKLREDGTYNPAFSTRTRHCWLDNPITWVNAEDYVQDVKSGWKRKFDDPQENYSADGVAMQVPRLFLDDLGSEANTEVNRDEIVRLITGRHARELPTWITTNLELPAIEERYGVRVLDRLRQYNAFIGVQGESRRG